MLGKLSHSVESSNVPLIQTLLTISSSAPVFAIKRLTSVMSPEERSSDHSQDPKYIFSTTFLGKNILRGLLSVHSSGFKP